ncbi:UDP-N-acetylmuramoyl-L-alanyl-D-glutamate--2,6-diaminopimelate ligase [Hippea jasoniae]|uniref:UDP-N-acetylmuramoyl-L-alanyl-D-glutamate--2, 6-diaminopimelate ligase n=1 Tax=Hippea jasoniae TaxID=944479 RepID=UPI00069149E0|nr:UDP-N-acetylmuramoyl-L-alanyl-D-glutamate--2,6-diaminopimelate ligase [Hippea jasoniae]
MSCLDVIKNFNPADLSYDSRNIKEGFVFFAYKGANADGNDYVEDVLKKGRVLVVSQRDFSDSRCIRVDDVKECMGKAADWFFGYPSKKLNVVGITGTNGKTTTTYLLKGIFDNSEVVGTIGYTIKDKLFKLKNTTPESIDLHRIFAEIYKNGSRWAFCEVSSHAVSLNRIAGIEFKLKVFTNISQDHLDFYKTMENYAKAKLSFFNKGDYKVVNIDDEYGKLLIDERAITYGFDSGAFIRPDEFEYSLDGIKARLKVGGRTMEIHSPLIGRYNIYNIMAAVGVAVFFGVDFAKIEEAIAKNRGAKGRLEFYRHDGVYAVVDYAHTDDAMKNVLEALNGVKKGRIITVFGAGGDRDRLKRPRMGRVAESLSDLVVITSDNPRSEDPERIIEDILGGIEDKKKVIVEPDRFEAIKKALKIAQKNDIVAILGKGHEDYQILKDKTIHFDDAEVVKKLWGLA